MNRVENTYSTRDKKNSGTSLQLLVKSQWFGLGVAIFLTLMVCLTINFRAFSEYRKEAAAQSALEVKIQSTTSENLAIQEQIHYLKNDQKTVEKEVRKFGLRRPKKQVSVTVNK